VPTTTGDWGLLGLDGGTVSRIGRIPHRGLGRRLDFRAVNYTVGVEQTAYFHAETVLTEDARGAVLCKLWLRTSPTSRVVLFVGAT
jgi:hypothetical protein